MSSLNDLSVENDVASVDIYSNLDDISNVESDYGEVQCAVHPLSSLFLCSCS